MIGATATPQKPFRFDIEGLRAVAVALVVVFHAFPAIVPAGFLGVDVFFVISGYLITRQIIDGRVGGQWSLLGFYGRRIRRLLPAFVACVTVVCVIGAVILLPADFAALAAAARAATLGFANHHALDNVGYFAAGASNAPLLHIWSLSVEEQFYVLFPILFWAVSRGGRGLALWACVAIGVGSFSAVVMTADSSPDETFYLMPYRAWELCVGAVLAQLPSLRAAGAACGRLAFLALAMIFTAAFLGDEPAALARPLAVGGAGLLIVAGVGPPALVQRFLACRGMQLLGRASYSIYLWHWPIMVFAAYAAVVPLSSPTRLLTILASVAVGLVSWRFVEAPARRRAWPRLAYGLAASTVLGLVAACWFVIEQAGAPHRFPSEVTRMAGFSDDRDQAAFGCRNPAVPIDASRLCTVGTGTGPVDWVVWGDSHAWALQESYSVWLARHGERGHVISYFGCPPVVGVTRLGYHRDCRAVGQAAMVYLKAHPPKNVVLVSIWTDYLTTDFRSDLSPARSGEVLPEAVVQTARELQALGVRVWLVDPMPQARADVPSALARNLYLGGEAELRFSAGEYATRNAPILAAFDQARPYTFARISPQDELCRTGMCRVTVQGRPLYFDSNHLAFSQSAYMAEVLQGTVRVQQ